MLYIFCNSLLILSFYYSIYLTFSSFYPLLSLILLNPLLLLWALSFVGICAVFFFIRIDDPTVGNSPDVPPSWFTLDLSLIASFPIYSLSTPDSAKDKRAFLSGHPCSFSSNYFFVSCFSLMYYATSKLIYPACFVPFSLVRTIKNFVYHINPCTIFSLKILVLLL